MVYFFGTISQNVLAPHKSWLKYPYLSSVWVRLLCQNCGHEVMMLRMKVGCLSLPVHILII